MKINVYTLHCVCSGQKRVNFKFLCRSKEEGTEIFCRTSSVLVRIKTLKCWRRKRVSSEHPHAGWRGQCWRTQRWRGCDHTTRHCQTMGTGLKILRFFVCSSGGSIKFAKFGVEIVAHFKGLLIYFSKAKKIFPIQTLNPPSRSLPSSAVGNMMLEFIHH